MNLTIQSKPLSFPMIDVLRGFAALSVVTYHVIEHFNWIDFAREGVLVWFRIGWMGVDLFFVISGFVIALSAFALLDNHTPAAFAREFTERRIRRIVPLYYLTCLIFLVFIVPQAISYPNIIPNILTHLFFVHNWDIDYTSLINGPNYTVAVELQFYCLILILAPILRTCRWWLIPLIALPLAWGWRYGVVINVPMGEASSIHLRHWASSQLPGTLDHFAAGILLARFIRWGGLKRVWPSASPQLSAAMVMLLAGVMIWIMLQVYWPRAGYWHLTEMVVFWRTLAAFAFATVILAACTLQFDKLIRWSAPLRYLGTISYGIYLWHLSVLLSVRRTDLFHAEQALILTIIITLIFAIGSWHLFEKPLLRRQLTIL